MKSLSILLASFAISLAIRISEYYPEGNIVSIGVGEPLTLSCLPNVPWDECEFRFTNGSNGKICQKYWSGDNVVKKCEGGIGKMYQKEGLCSFEIEDVKFEDAGSWTCKMTDNNENSVTHPFDVKVENKTTPMTTPTTPPANATSTRPTEFMTFCILAFTFLIIF